MSFYAPGTENIDSQWSMGQKILIFIGQGWKISISSGPTAENNYFYRPGERKILSFNGLGVVQGQKILIYIALGTESIDLQRSSGQKL